MPRIQSPLPQRCWRPMRCIKGRNMAAFGKIVNFFKYGLGPGRKQRKWAGKARERQSRFDSDLWRKKEDIASRRYDSYEDYVAHQSAKLEGIYERLKEKEPEDLGFFRHRLAVFRQLKDVEGVHSVLCLGARLGTEVRVLHEMGLFAVGIDLNPGPQNPYVIYGDFQNLVFPDASIDAIYTNALDHVFDLERVLSEVRRLLVDKGMFVADLLPGFAEGFVAGEYESLHWRSLEEFAEHIARLGGLRRESTCDLGTIRRDHWYQVVFRKAER